MAVARLDLQRDGARATRATLGEYEVTLLAFPPGFRLPAFEIDRGYVAIVLDGALVKNFVCSECALSRDSFVTLPRGAEHTTAFAETTTRIVVVRDSVGHASQALAPIVSRHRHVRATATSSLAWRLAAELRARDSSWALAAEGLVLQLLAVADRAAAPSRAPRAGWLRVVRDLLHDALPDHPASLGELARAVGVHPAHLARSFRHEYGSTVGEYARSLRLDWAAAQLALDDAPLADVAVRAGFADQSHFTRAFRRHTGVTPGRYRRIVRG